MSLILSPLNKTWLFDVDGTLVKHNGHKIDGEDTLLPGVKDFLSSLSKEDKVILLTSRKSGEIKKLKEFLIKNDIRFDHIISDLPYGERIIVNDFKPSGLSTAFSLNKKRDAELEIDVMIDRSL
ncbi:putative uncharacterized protein [Proteobacteria bacterium CAG:139]|jgi:hypothetical protein|nr:putative uncharacterized protein [Proteobacteria bacterium CAG:139]